MPHKLLSRRSFIQRGHTYNGPISASIVIDGDSRNTGGYLGPQWWELLRDDDYRNAPLMRWTDKASGGQTITQCTSDVVSTVCSTTVCPHDTWLPYSRRVLIIWMGVNDMRTEHVTGATAFSRLQTYLQTVSAKKIYHHIIVLLQIPTTTKDGLPLNADLATFNSTITTNWGNDGASDIRASGATSYIDLPALYPGIFDDFTDYTGSFNNTDYYILNDKVHLTEKGRQLVADAVRDHLETLDLTHLPFRAEGVLAWLQWDKGITYGNSTYVNTWKDRLNSHRWLQGTESAQPTVDSSGQQINFDADSLYLLNTYRGRNIFQNCAGMGFSVNMSSDVVVSGADDDWVFQFSTGPSSSNYRLGLRLQNSVIQMRVRADDADSGTAAQGGSYSAGEKFNVTGYVDVNDIATTGAYVNKNGTLLQKITSGYTGGSGVKTSDTASNRANIGAVGTSVYFDGKCPEMIFFDARHENYIPNTQTYMLNRPWLTT